MIFAMLQEYCLLKKGDKIYVQVDFKSDEKDFLILFASVLFGNKSIVIPIKNYTFLIG